jgi:ABC-2 type transport system ATP-binding protein
VIEVDQLTKRYGDRTAVRDVSFTVQKGEIVGFLGPNGAGKTTTLRMITGFLQPTAGRVSIDGIDAFAEPVRARSKIGYLPEGVPLYPEMRVSEYLRFRARLKGVARADVRKRVEQSLEMAGVADSRDRIIGQLSKGYRQRVGLADALVADPPLLILDEPTSGLDPNQMRLVRELVRGFGGDKTVFLSTHILPEVEATCTRVVIINKGRVVGSGSTDTLRQGAEQGQLVTLVGRGAAAKLRELLEKVEGVRAVLRLEPHGGYREADVHEVRLRTEASPDVLERIFRAVAEGGLVLRELSREVTRLEDVFADLTTEEEEGEEAADEDEDEESETEAETESEAESEAESEPETEAETDAETEAETEAETDADTEADEEPQK